MEWSEEGIVIGTRRYGETGTILEAMTRDHGRHLGLVRGGRSRRQRPVLQPGNTLALTWRARLDEHLGSFRAEPVRERAAGLMETGFASFGLQLLGAHLRLLPERDPHPRLFDALELVVENLGKPGLAAELMARFELLLLDELGFGLDLAVCAATGAIADLIYVSPKSGRAVSREAGLPFDNRLLRLPAFLATPGGPDSPRLGALDDSFALTGFFLERHVYGPRSMPPPDPRSSFIRAVAVAVGGRL